MSTSFDYIVIGGGSAGAVLAGRLSARHDLRVLLLEAGPDMLPGREPAAVRDTYYTTFFEPGFFWPDLRVQFGVQPGAAAPGEPARRYEQARVLGGGSSINAMIALRGMPGDFEEWQQAGAAGWNWQGVLPYYRKLERDLDFEDAWHGRDGPIPVRRHRREQWPGFCQAVASCLERKGWKFVADMNGPVANGFCAVPMSSTPEQRVSAAMGYLDDAVRRRPNLEVITGAYVERVLIESGRARGVAARLADGRRDFHGREVIVAAGALHSPAVLMRSGVGPARELSALGIDLKLDLPGVGSNLQEHPAVSVASHLKPGARQQAQLRPATNVALRYDSAVSGCVDSDMYISVTNKTSWHRLGARIGALVLCVYKPYSRGSVSLAARDPDVEPAVRFNLLSDERDLERLARAFHLARDIYASPELAAAVNDVFPTSYSERIRNLNRISSSNAIRATAAAIALDGPSALRRWLLANVVSPGASLEELAGDASRLRSWLKERATGFYHPVGTCRMGSAADPAAVVDPECRVRGASGLRVIDASVMPTITRANTNLTTIMIAERMADRMLAGSR